MSELRGAIRGDGRARTRATEQIWRQWCRCLAVDEEEMAAVSSISPPTQASHVSLLVASAILLWSASAFGFEVTEEALNLYVEQGLAKKTNRDVQILNPKISLLDGFATICAKVRTVIFPKDVDFCADMTPKWRQESGSLLATKISLVSLSARGVREKDIELVKAILNQVILPGLEGVEVYKADNFIGKQISWVKVLPGKLEMGF